MVLHGLDSCSCLPQERRILLRNLAHFSDGLTYLLYPCPLFLARLKDFGHYVGHILRAANDLIHRCSRIRDEFAQSLGAHGRTGLKTLTMPVLVGPLLMRSWSGAQG